MSALVLLRFAGARSTAILFRVRNCFSFLEWRRPAIELRHLVTVPFRLITAPFRHHIRYAQNEWELFTGQLSSAAGVSETGRPRGFPPWASPDRAEAFALLAEHLPLLVQASDLPDAERRVCFLPRLAVATLCYAFGYRFIVRIFIIPIARVSPFYGFRNLACYQ